jgi:D-alanyl-D-alanine dipeptidase
LGNLTNYEDFQSGFDSLHPLQLTQATQNQHLKQYAQNSRLALNIGRQILPQEYSGLAA